MRIKKSCLLYGEGQSEKKFISALVDLANFKYYTQKNWHFQRSSGAGGSAKVILQGCINMQESGQYALCFCDVDVIEKELKDGKSKWQSKGVTKKIEKEMKELDRIALKSNVIIIWQHKTLEDEFVQVLGDKYKGVAKSRLLKLAIKEKVKFINTPYYKRILKALQELERMDS